MSLARATLLKERKKGNRGPKWTFSFMLHQQEMFSLGLSVTDAIAHPDVTNVIQHGSESEFNSPAESARCCVIGGRGGVLEVATWTPGPAVRLRWGDPVPGRGDW